MSKKQELNINKLGYPKWFGILFFCLTVLGPIILIVIEGLQAPNTTIGTIFKISFMAISIAIVAWFFLKKMIISKIETKLLAKQVALEHDYSIDVGNPDKIKYLWYKNEARLTLFNMISVSLYGGLSFLICLGVASALLQIKGIIFLITIMYLVAYTTKFMIITARGGITNEQE